MAKKRALLEYVGYIKRDRSDSIVNTCSEKHIVGFFHAWQDVKLLIEKDGQMLGAWKEGFIAIGAIKIRDIKKSCLPLDEKMALYRMVGKYVQSNISKEERYLRFQTKYYMLVNTLLNMLEEEQCVEKIEARIGEMMKKSWSCWDIQHSLFLGGDEIRACCKRFFYDGCQKGDVVLAKLSQGMSGKEVYQTFEKEKKRLYIDINKGEKKECEGCPYLSFENWDNDFGIKKISFEYHSLCNLRCNYCSDTYYGGRVPVYDIVEFVDKLVQEGLLSECESIVWGGGEPTLEKNFVTLLQKIMENNIGASHNVITNATKYVPELSDFLTSGRINLITSIDAGTNETYRKIRGKDLLDTVWNNLNQYAKKNASKIIIKYIVKKENCNLEELNCFVNKIEEYCLEDCNFQISCDFNQESLEYEEKLGVVVLYGLLRKKGVEIIYFDELLRERLKKDEGELEKIDSDLQKLGLSHIRLRRRLENIVIWGSDNQIKSLLDHTIYFADVKPVGLIAGHASYYGKECGGLCYQSPKDFKNQDVCFVIAAVQGTRRIYDEFIREGFSKQQLITELIL